MSSNDSAVKKEDPGAAKKHPQYALLDIKKKNDLVWYTKIPDFFQTDWRLIKNETCIGEITVYPQPNGHPKLKAHFNESSIKSFDYNLLPKEFTIDVDDRIEPNRYIFSHGKDTGIVRLVGRVNAEVNIKGDPTMLSNIRNYLDKKAKTEKKRDPKVDGELPVPEVSENYQGGLRYTHEEKRPKDKRIKKPEGTIKIEILNLFKENAEWKLKDMASRIDQNQNYVSSIVKKVGTYNQTTGTWKIKEDLVDADDE